LGIDAVGDEARPVEAGNRRRLCVEALGDGLEFGIKRQRRLVDDHRAQRRHREVAGDGPVGLDVDGDVAVDHRSQISAHDPGSRIVREMWSRMRMRPE